MNRFLTCLFAFSLLFVAPVEAAERPNVILIMVDDLGFSDLGYHGSEIETPNIDALAAGGVRFSQFYNSGRCCPTRATLMTGLHPHQTGIGWMTQPPGSKRGKSEPPAYQGHLNESCVTIAEALKGAGYGTLMTGKWHLGAGDRSDWPMQRGFEKYYGCVTGATRFFYPDGDRGISLGNEPVDPPLSTTDEAYYTTDAFTDYAIQFVSEHREERADDPFFLYLAYTAPHWPLQAFEDDIARYRGKYKEGWDKLREARYAKQIELGLIDEDWPLSPKTPGIPDWDSLDEEKQDEMDLKMAVYAAMVDRVDQNIGKLIENLKAEGAFENTLILFLSDNGACQEGGMLGRGDFFDVEKRNKDDSNSYGEAWANAGSTPFRYYKHFTHEGGSATPFFMHWPAKIEPRADWYGEPGQLIDIMPTILDVAGAVYPETMRGNGVPALDGISLRPSFNEKPLNRTDPIFLEHETNASVRDGKWKLVGKEVAMLAGTNQKQWELYDMESDRTEVHDLASANPEKVRSMARLWEAWANRVGVYPRGKGSPSSAAGGKGDGHGIPSALKPEPNPPQIVGREFTVTANVRAPKPNGVVLAQGGNAFGYSLYFKEGRPSFAWRNKSKLTVVAPENPVKGKVALRVRVSEKEITMSVNGKPVASGKIDGFLAEQPGLGLFLAGDGVHAVGDYKVPNRFNGKLLDYKVEVIVPRVAMRTPWAEKVTPENVWDAYPRPQLRRDKWTNLNGMWNYAVVPKGGNEVPGNWDGEILVPFAIEAPLSGVERRFTPEDALWYQRTMAMEKKEGMRYFLNFEAVDYESTVWVNGVEVGRNTGGSLPLRFEITDAAASGENTVVVKVTDATDQEGAYQLHGKQRLNPKGIFYTPVSGIWQTVWMEEVPALHVDDVKVTTKASGRITVAVTLDGYGRGDDIEVMVLHRGDEIAGKRGKEGVFEITVPNPRLWSPNQPNLYDLRITAGKDVVNSYFGIRETGIGKDDAGHWRFTLNGNPIFHWGTLDQGWWPDGLLTPPSEEAMVSDIQFLKDAGFNTIRKHIKVEPRRYYYHCDKMGMLVWQDQVSAMADNPEWTRLKPNPPTVEWPEEAHAQFMAELKLMMDTLHNHPSIVQWVPFNERWGQHQTLEVGKWTTDYDKTRQVNIASGGNFFPGGHIVDAHHYPHPEFPFGDGEGGRFTDFVKVMGEFGGHGFPVEGHVWDTKTRNWGYGGLPKDKAEWLERYRTSIEMLADLKRKGIAAGIYTQTTDVEGEINGLLTYDRKVQKIAPGELKAISAQLFE
ncbi:sulfatase-like hydrolase/transferase [Verrucomicrobiales bacterium BCK34]|nr:sulfatase-like hydrolase/transferase [Verrucomicrobiales bacterium BCK34]